ncbi:MAG: protein kinase [Planctomycetaceae bacterium]|nr:protein kinase [Planctomycetaceae bacterium]
MPTPKACERCGATFESSPGLDGLCGACLFKASLEPEVSVNRGAERRPVPEVPALAPHFPDLEILELIGQGGMGAVYRVRQKSLGREAALKVLALDGGSDPAFGERFEREARLLASLAHPNIVSVYGAGRAGPHWYLLMELVEGASLRQMIAAHELDPRSALAIVGQVCDALQAAHDRGVVHRDIKPENVIVTRKGTAKILDFGLAKLVGQGPRTANTLTETGQVMGTVRYMAPEQWDRPLAVDHRADIYSLGVVMYELLTGELPMGRFPLPSSRTAVGANVDRIVLKTLEKEPAQRYQHASEVRIDVDRAAKAPQPKPTPQREPASRGEGDRAESSPRAGIVRVLRWTAAFGVVGMLLSCLVLVLMGALGIREALVVGAIAFVPIGLAAILLLVFRERGASGSSRGSLLGWGCFAALLLLGAVAGGSALLFKVNQRRSALAEHERAQRDARAAMEASIEAEIESMPLVVPGEVSSIELLDDGRGGLRYSGLVQRELQARFAPFARLTQAGTPELMARARWAILVWAMHASLLDLSVLRDKTTTLEDVVTYRIPELSKQLERNRRIAEYLFLNLESVASAGTLDSENFIVVLPAGRLILSDESLYWRFELTQVSAALGSVADRAGLDARCEQALAEVGLVDRMEFGREEWRVEIRGAHSAAPTGRITLPDGRVRELDTATLTSRYGLLLHLAR